MLAVLGRAGGREPVPRTTPFHARVDALCESKNWLLWAGHLSPVTYETDHLREYYAIRSSAALLDVSPLFKYLVSGPDAGRLLDRVGAAYANYASVIAKRQEIKECPGCGRMVFPESGRQKYCTKSCASTGRWCRWKALQSDD
jgi:hypothetical protein